MRITAVQRVQIKQQFTEILGADCELRLFGSRADDDARGGDLDLLVRSPRLLPRKVILACRLAARAERLMGGRRVDVLLVDPETALLAIHQDALAAAFGEEGNAADRPRPRYHGPCRFMRSIPRAAAATSRLPITANRTAA